MAFTVDSADFDGTNDFMKTGAGLIGAADSKSGILSIWFRMDGGDGVTNSLLRGATTVGGTTERFIANRQASDNPLVQGRNAAGATIFLLFTNGTYTAGPTWRHFLSSWDLAAGAAHLYMNDTSDLFISTLTDDTIDYTVADWAIGAQANGGAKLNGCVAEFYFAPGQFLDFSVVANRRKFISAAGEAVNLGATGALPTGTAPLVYQHLDLGETVSNFATNRGPGGIFAITGTLDTGSTAPIGTEAPPPAASAAPRGNAGAFLASWEKLRPRKRDHELQRSRGEFEVYVRAEELIALVAARHLDSDTDTMIADAMKEFESHYMRWDLEYVGDLIDERDRLVREREERKRKELEGRAGWLERRSKQERNKKT